MIHEGPYCLPPPASRERAFPALSFDQRRHRRSDPQEDDAKEPPCFRTACPTAFVITGSVPMRKINRLMTISIIDLRFDSQYADRHSDRTT